MGGFATHVEPTTNGGWFWLLEVEGREADSGEAASEEEARAYARACARERGLLRPPVAVYAADPLPGQRLLLCEPVRPAPAVRYGIGPGPMWQETLRAHHAGADWAVVPDLGWVRRVLWTQCVLLLPVVDGARPDRVQPHLGELTGLYVAGSPGWQHRTLPRWGEVAAESDCWLHVAGAPDAARCVEAGATSAGGFRCNEPRRPA